MSISAISSLSSYSSYSCIDPEYEIIKQRLKTLNIAVTGNKTVDKANLEKSTKSTTSTTSTTTTTETTNNVSTSSSTELNSNDSQTLKTILSELGIMATEDTEADYRRAVNALRTKYSDNSGNVDISHLNYLKQNLDRIVSGLGIQVLNISMSERMGQSMLGDINKTMMVTGISAPKQ